jgi:hypothetical protein
MGMHSIAWGRLALGLSALTGLGLAGRAYVSSPGRVPVHFAPNGFPDRWGSPLELLLVHACVIVMASGLSLTLPEIIRRGSSQVINLPNKEYWLLPEHRDAAATKAAGWAYAVGTAVNLLMILLQVLLPRDASVAAPVPALTLVLLGFVAFILGSCIWFWLAYDLPARSE